MKFTIQHYHLKLFSPHEIETKSCERTQQRPSIKTNVSYDPTSIPASLKPTKA